MKKHINADFFKLLIAFLIICASLKPGLSDASVINTETSIITVAQIESDILKYKHINDLLFIIIR